MKKILLTIMFFITAFIISGCTGKTVTPEISDPEKTYLTAQEGDITYTIDNQKMYSKLKKQFGVNILLDIVDEYLMKEMKSDNISYWNQVTREMIDEEVTNDVFPKGTNNLSPEEIEEQRNDYFDELFVDYGLVTEDDIYDYYRLLVAKELYAKEKLQEQYLEEDFTKTEYQSYFDKNYQTEYNAIIITYDSIKQYEDAFKQLGIRINNAGQWLKISDATALTDREVVKAFIDLYNMNNSHFLENYPTETLVLNQDVEYKIVDGEIQFDIEKIDMLHYTNKEISSFQLEVRNYVDKQMSSYPEGTSWYTNQALAYKGGSRHIFVLKIAEKTYELEDKKEEIREKLLESKLTNEYIASTFAKLRDEKGLVIYDKDIQNKYYAQVGAWVSIKEFKQGHKSLIGKVEDLEISADELFVKMDNNYGISVAASELNYLRYIYNTDINKIYNIKEKTILNESKWSAIKQDIEDEKRALKDNAYADYGFPKSYGWENFIKDFYSVDNETELRYYYLYQDIKREYALSLGDLSEEEETGDLWQYYLEHMNNKVEEYYYVEGIQLVISVVDIDGAVVNPEDWTELQNNLAKEFYRNIIDYLEAEPGSYKIKMNSLVDAYNKAPRFLPGLEQTTAGQPVIAGIDYKYKDLEVSKYKSAGLKLNYQNMGTFKNNQQYAELDEVIRTIWKDDPNAEIPYLYGYSSGEYQYLTSSQGYHIYLNNKSLPISSWTDDNIERVLPKLSEIQIYIKDQSDKKLTAEVKAAISVYYLPIYSELTGVNNVTAKVNTVIRNYQYELKTNNYSIDNYLRYLDLQITKAENALKFK